MWWYWVPDPISNPTHSGKICNTLNIFVIKFQNLTIYYASFRFFFIWGPTLHAPLMQSLHQWCFYVFLNNEYVSHLWSLFQSSLHIYKFTLQWWTSVWAASMYCSVTSVLSWLVGTHFVVSSVVCMSWIPYRHAR